MKELSELLKEAKPLYYEQKRRRTQIKRACFSLVLILTVLASGFGGYALKSSSGDYIASYDSSGSTSDSYLPVDEYGLITVAY